MYSVSYKSLPLSTKVVISYMILEHLINDKKYLTFKEIVENTGLCSRTVRSVLQQLKRLDLVKTLIDISRGNRRHIYRLNFNKLRLTNCRIEDGLYLIDIGFGLRNHMTFKAFRIINQSDLVFYTSHVSSRILELCREDARKYNLQEVTNDVIEEELNKSFIHGEIVSIIYDLLIDFELINKCVNVAQKIGLKVHYAFLPSPLQLLLHRTADFKRMLFKRGNIAIEVTRELGPENTSGIIKMYRTRYGNCNELIIEELKSSNYDESSDCTYILYRRLLAE